MRYFPLVVISSIFLSATTTDISNIQEKQLTKHIKVQYQGIEQKGDDSKFEIILKDPYFFWTDSSPESSGDTEEDESTVAVKVGVEVPGNRANVESGGLIQHTGTVKIWVDIPRNTAKVESVGVTRIVLGNSKKPLEMFIDGKITKTAEGDFSKIKEVFAKIRAGNITGDEVLTILKNVNKASLEGNNVKISIPDIPKNMVIESGKINYEHTSGATPEQFTIYMKSTADNKKHHFLDTDKRDNTVSGTLSLAPWSKFVDFARKPDWMNMPESKASWDLTSKSELDTSTSKALFSSIQGENPSFSFDLNNKTDFVTDWAQQLIASAKRNPPKEEINDRDSQVQLSIYQWLTSPKTLPLLSRIPLQSTLNLNGLFQYSAVPSLNLSLLGKKQSGIKLSFNGIEGRNKMDSGELQLTLVGGRPLYNRLVTLYNSFVESVAPFLSKNDESIKPLTPELKDKLYQLLLAYTADPKIQDKELKFNIKYAPDNKVTIGNRTLIQFFADITSVFQIPIDDTIQDELIEDEVMDVR